MENLNGAFIRRPGMSLDQATAIFGKRWGWVLAAGIGLILVGIAALMVPVVSTVGLTIAIASILLASGIIHLIQAVQCRKEQGSAVRFMQAAWGILAGAFIFFYPGLGILGVALTIAFYFFVSAALQWIFASAMAPKNASLWGYLGSGISFCLGIFIIMSLPVSALWVPGTLLGIELIFSGVSLSGLAFSLRKLQRVEGGKGQSHRGMGGGLHPAGQTT